MGSAKQNTLDLTSTDLTFAALRDALATSDSLTILLSRKHAERVRALVMLNDRMETTQGPAKALLALSLAFRFLVAIVMRTRGLAVCEVNIVESLSVAIHSDAGHRTHLLVQKSSTHRSTRAG